MEAPVGIITGALDILGNLLKLTGKAEVEDRDHGHDDEDDDRNRRGQAVVVAARAAKGDAVGVTDQDVGVPGRRACAWDRRAAPLYSWIIAKLLKLKAKEPISKGPIDTSNRGSVKRRNW